MKTKTLLIIILASLTLMAPAQTPETKYQKIRKMNVLAEKKREFLALGHADRVRVWREHFQYVFLTEPLEPEQRDYLLRSIDAFEAGELTDDLDREARDLFDFELGRRVFNLGPWTGGGSSCTAETQKRRGFEFEPETFSALRVFTSPQPQLMAPADCNCGQTSTNWGCSGSCGPSGCTSTPDGCSIFYMYPCNGKCSSQEIE